VKRLACITIGALIGFAYIFFPWPSDARREARWHQLQQRQFLHDFQQQRHDEYGDPAPTVPALTPAEQTELDDLDKWAESRGERFKPDSD
jgi:hypothetical protein